MIYFGGNSMKLSDFKKGQTVYIRGGYRKSDVEIREVKVQSVGRKYVTVDYWGGMRFDATKNFVEVTNYTPNYKLYLSREQIENEILRGEKESKVSSSFRWENRLTEKMSDEDLDKIIEIINKYKERKE